MPAGAGQYAGIEIENHRNNRMTVAPVEIAIPSGNIPAPKPTIEYVVSYDASISATGVFPDQREETMVAIEYPVEGVELNETEVIFVEGSGREFQLQAAVIPENATNKSVQWTCSDSSVAMVDNDGLVTVVGGGAAVITVTTVEGNFTATCKVSLEIAAIGIDINATSMELSLGEERRLAVLFDPADACNKEVTWSVDPVGAVSVDENGLVKALNSGTAIVTVTTDDRMLSASCHVVVVGPPVGASFVNAKIYDFSLGSGNIFPEIFNDPTAARFVDMDLEHVLISGRERQETPILLRFAELKQGKILPILVNKAGVHPSEFPFSRGQMQHGNVYVCNMILDLGGDDPFKIYHWNKTRSGSAPQHIVNYTSLNDVQGIQTGTSGHRWGDNMSVNLDENGNGYIFVFASGQTGVIRITVSNFTRTSGAKYIALTESSGTPGPYPTINRVDGFQNEYLLSGHIARPILINAEGDVLYSMSSFRHNSYGVSAQIVTFNEARYLIVMNDAGAEGSCDICVYNISKGSTTVEALQLFDAIHEIDRSPVFTFSLGAGKWSGMGVKPVEINWVKDGDNKLYIVGSAVEAGFAIIELSAK